jgi:hypothetical protein
MFYSTGSAADPHNFNAGIRILPFTLTRILIRILLFSLMRIWIKILPLTFRDLDPPMLQNNPVRLPPFPFDTDADRDPDFHFDADPNPQH